MIYFDNAATTIQKPDCVVQAVTEALCSLGNSGRGVHSGALNAARIIYDTRAALAQLFGAENPERIAFTANATLALNTAIKGILNKGDHVIISSLEHNSVTRPIHALQEKGIITYSVFSVCEDKEETLENFKKAFTRNTKLCVVTAVSNVFGNVLPIKELSRVAHSMGAYFFVDGAQGAGVIPISMKNDGIDCLCIPGHKGLLGPMGTGALLHGNIDFKPFMQGGTGSFSFDLNQPENFPERLESGTLNVPGICGLKEGLKVVKKIGVNNIRKKENAVCKEIFEGLKDIKKVKLYRDFYNEELYAPVLSFNIDGLHSEQVSAMLDRGGVAVRGGFHCSPLAHISMGTKDTGTVRISPSFRTTKKDINILLNLIRKIAIKEFI